MELVNILGRMDITGITFLILLVALVVSRAWHYNSVRTSKDIGIILKNPKTET